MTPPSPVRDDPDLGRVRRCPSCREWWPDDAEFFASYPYSAGAVVRARGRTYVRGTGGVTKRCRACVTETQRESNRRARLRQAENRMRMTGYCRGAAGHTCPVRLPLGRTQCNGCAGRTVGALTPERIREHLRAFRRLAAVR